MGGAIFGGEFLFVSRGAYIRGGAYIRDFMVSFLSTVYVLSYVLSRFCLLKDGKFEMININSC